MKRARIDKIDEKTHRVMLGDHEIGTSKTSFDAQFHVNAINDALDVAHLEGEKYLERMVVGQRIDLELTTEISKAKADWYKRSQMFLRDEELEEKTKATIVTSSGGVCKKCGGLTTYTRQNSASGECFSCEHKLKTPPSKSDGGASFI